MIASLLFIAALQTTQPPAPAAGQQAADAPATMRGRVLAADGRTLAGAHLRLIRSDNPQRPRNQSTDDDGAFEFTDLAAGAYSLIADKSGFANSIAVPVVLTAGETKEHIDVTLRKLSAIAGRVVDENGDPIEGMVINAMRLRAGGGRRVITTGSQRRTDELGRYRVYNLQPGDYIVSASVGSVNGPPLALVPGYATTFFPGTTDAKDAQVIHVPASESSVPNIDFSLIAVRTASIFGQMIGADGGPFQGGIQLSPSRRSGGAGGGSVGAITYHDGRFEFPNVAPGDYVIDSTHNNEHGFAWVSVNGADVTGVIVQTQPGSTMSGRIVFEGNSPPAGRISLVAVPVDPDVGTGGQPSATMRGDGTFQLGALYGARRFRVGSSPGWALKAILANGQDVSDMALTFGAQAQSMRDVEVVMTDQLTAVNGSVRGTTTGAYVFVFSDDRDRCYEGSRYYAGRPTVDGTFSIAGLPPGGYLITALTNLPEGLDAGQMIADADLLERLSRDATHVLLNERQTTTVALRVVSLQ
jgi:hypothetical protein